MASTQKPPVTVTFLQMLNRPERIDVHPPVKGIRFERIVEAPVPFYRDMYSAIGGTWRWSERMKLPDEQVKKIIQHAAVYIYVLRLNGRIVGFAELDYRHNPDIELKYFGLVPECIGQGLGTYFLSWIIKTAWELNPGRVWLHTCSNDHPRALDTYVKSGFVRYKTETIPENGS